MLTTSMNKTLLSIALSLADWFELHFLFQRIVQTSNDSYLLSR